MKKLIAAAVATSVSAIAFADVSITGNANYEYFHKEDSGYNTNYADTEINLSIKGKSGDTTVVANFEVDSHGNADTALDIEDTYITSKIGDVNVKAGNFASGTTALGGEIDQGGRATNKVDLSTSLGTAKIGYAQEFGGSATDAGGTDSASVYASMPIGGVNFSVKEQSDSYTIMGASGSFSGVDFRVEQKDNDSSATGDILFYNVGTKLGDIDVSYAAIDADKGGSGATTDPVTEGDSAIFAQEMAVDADSIGKTGVDGVSQITLGTTVDGTALKLRVGELRGAATYKDAGFSRIEASRTLASGAKLVVSYDDYEDTGVTTGAMSDTQLLEIDLSISF
jgi:hypothetical protein